MVYIRTHEINFNVSADFPHAPKFSDCADLTHWSGPHSLKVHSVSHKVNRGNIMKSGPCQPHGLVNAPEKTDPQKFGVYSLHGNESLQIEVLARLPIEWKKKKKRFLPTADEPSPPVTTVSHGLGSNHWSRISLSIWSKVLLLLPPSTNSPISFKWDQYLVQVPENFHLCTLVFLYVYWSRKANLTPTEQKAPAAKHLATGGK